jgi:predicted nucleotide-binding protein
MDTSVIEKFKNNFAAFLVGAMASAATVWSVADNLHKKEVTIIEREKAELQRRLSEAEAALKTQVALPNANVTKASLGRKQEIEALIQSLDAEIKAKKVELARNAPITVGGPKDEGYMRVEGELRSLQQQRDNARLLLIGVVGGKP